MLCKYSFRTHLIIYWYLIFATQLLSLCKYINYIYICIYRYIYRCVCMCMCLCVSPEASTPQNRFHQYFLRRR